MHSVKVVATLENPGVFEVFARHQYGTMHYYASPLLREALSYVKTHEGEADFQILYPDGRHHDWRDGEPRISDPFCDTERCADRLMKDWHTHGKLVVAVDFDNTVFDYHKVGYIFGGVIDLLQKCNSLGMHLMLYTAAEPERHAEQVVYLETKGVHIDSVNESPVPSGLGCKQYYNILLDDRAGLGQAKRILAWVLADIEEIQRKRSEDLPVV